MITIEKIKNMITDDQLDFLYRAREEELNIIESEEKKIKYDDILRAINNVPPCFKETKKNIIKKIDLYLEQERNIQSNDIEKTYKVGFCDAINLILNSSSKNEVK